MKKILSSSILAITGLTVALPSFAYPNIPANTQLATKQYYSSTLSTQPPSLDPSIAYDTASNAILKSLFQPLVREDVNGKVIPSAAESWTISDDGKVYTFKIRPAKWSNGDKVTAHDFEYSWKRLVDPKNGSQAMSYLNDFNVLNATLITKGEKDPSELGVKALDDDHFQVTLTSPVPWFLTAITYTVLSPVHKATVEKYGINWTRPENMVNNGAFLLDSLKINEIITLKKNPNYFDADKVVIQGASYRIIKDRLQTYRGFLAGEYDVAGIPKTEFESAIKNPGFISAPQFTTYAFAINLKNPKMADVNVRKAIAYALDSKTIVEKIVRNNQLPASGWTPPYLNEAEKITGADYLKLTMAERSKEVIRLLTNAGYSKSHPFEFTLLSSSGDAELKQRYAAIQSQMQTASGNLLKINLESIEWKVFLERTREGNFDVSYAGWGADFNHASNFLGVFVSTNSVNYPKLNSTQYDKYYNDATLSPNVSERETLYAKGEDELLNKEYAIIPFQFGINNLVKNVKLKNYSLKAIAYYLEDLYFVK